MTCTERCLSSAKFLSELRTSTWQKHQCGTISLLLFWVFAFPQVIWSENATLSGRIWLWFLALLCESIHRLSGLVSTYCVLVWTFFSRAIMILEWRHHPNITCCKSHKEGLFLKPLPTCMLNNALATCKSWIICTARGANLEALLQCEFGAQWGLARRIQFSVLQVWVTWLASR